MQNDGPSVNFEEIALDEAIEELKMAAQWLLVLKDKNGIVSFRGELRFADAIAHLKSWRHFEDEIKRENRRGL